MEFALVPCNMFPRRVFEVTQGAETTNRNLLWLGEDLGPKRQNKVLISQELVEFPMKQG